MLDVLPRLPTTVVLVIVTWLAWRQWKKLAQRKLEDAFGVEHGCLPIQAVTVGKWPGNLDLAKGLWDANSDGKLLAYQGRFIEKLGPNIEQRIIGDVGIVTLDPENVKAVLSKSKIHEGELDFVYGSRRDAFLPLLGEGLFTQDGPPWKHSRELLRRQFTRLQYSQHLDIFKEHVEMLIARLQKAASSDGTIDMQPLFFNFTLDTTTDLLFGESADSLREGSVDAFGTSFDEASWITAVRVRMVDYYWMYSPPRYSRACNQVKQYANQYVNKALNQTDDASSDRYAFVRSLYNDLHNRDLVRDQLINVLLAGRDTTACLLSWTFRLLVRHRIVLERLIEEISSVLDGSSLESKAQIRQMPYLKNVLNETLRLYPSVPINVRMAAQPSVIPTGGGPDGTHPVMVRKGQGVGFSPYFMHRRKDLFGKDADEFRPERWEERHNGQTLMERVGWGYLPFNGGPRICLGQEFALLEASYAIVSILQSFPGIRLAEGEKFEPIGEERQTITFTVSPTDGCHVQL